MLKLKGYSAIGNTGTVSEVNHDNRIWHRMTTDSHNIYKGIQASFDITNEVKSQAMLFKAMFRFNNKDGVTDSNLRLYAKYSSKGIGYKAIKLIDKKLKFNEIINIAEYLTIPKDYQDVDQVDLQFENSTDQAMNVEVADVQLFLEEDELAQKGLPVINLAGNFEEINGDKEGLFSFDFVNEKQHIVGYTKTKWQGSSSKDFPAKNLKIKLYKDANLTEKFKFKPRPDFPETNKFNLKVNFVQPFEARNLVNSKLFAEIAATRNNLSAGLENSPMYGEIQGLPVICHINGEYYALMTLNTAKDDDTWGLDNEDEQFVLEGAGHSQAAKFNAETFTVGDDTTADFSLEYPDELTAKARATMEQALRFVKNSGNLSTEQIKVQLPAYFDIGSVIDWMIFIELAQIFDETDKNICWACYDSQHLTAVPYDVDSTWGLHWLPQQARTLDEKILENAKNNGNKLIGLMLDNYGIEINARWTELKQAGVVTIPHIQGMFADYIAEIGSGNLEKHWNKWPDSAPVKHKTDYNELMRSVRLRVMMCDQFFNELK